MDLRTMPLFKVSKVFHHPTKHLQQYFMCHRVWQAAMPYKVVEIEPEQKYRWNWRIKDNINFVLFKWNFEHTFTSIQEDHPDHLFIRFENSNQVTNFTGKIKFEETHEEQLDNKVSIEFDKLNLKDPLLNSVKFAFIDIMKKDYKTFLGNVYQLLQDNEKRMQVLQDCYWTDYNTISY
jgi:NDP-sugar pyrophosphorylase family protein